MRMAAEETGRDGDSPEQDVLSLRDVRYGSNAVCDALLALPSQVTSVHIQPQIQPQARVAGGEKMRPC